MKNYNKLNLKSEFHIATLEGVKLRFKKMKHIQSYHFYQNSYSLIYSNK